MRLLLFLVALRERENLCATRVAKLVVSKSWDIIYFVGGCALRWAHYRVWEAATLSHFLLPFRIKYTAIFMEFVVSKLFQLTILHLYIINSSNITF